MPRGNRLPLDQLAPYLLEVPAPFGARATDSSNGRSPSPPTPHCIDWRTLFGNDRPVEIEVGFGKGLFLLTSAQAHPEVNYIGIEILRKYQLFTAARLAKRELGNVRLACADARMFLRDQVSTGSVRAMHVYFPDPWWKKRHEKRRLFTGEFVVQCERVLHPAGRLNLVTDVEEYFGMMQCLLSEKTTLHELTPPRPGTPEHDLDYLTNFERKFRKEGKPIWRAVYEQVAKQPLPNAPSS